ncbi:hypothetical protein QFZ77_002987 [Paenibacillus sp. V4I3]|uniref:hypothetical protein n=1 Tax=Paenibacillus sp. V4I3 TaxID=3042305 RepID=UPI0027896393|nr:hypothetical protein [Paenibacillus sp. V4I3]MDQ0874328.1 hypothetical protein [Paenibacillus sp. V4I3]
MRTSISTCFTTLMLLALTLSIHQSALTQPGPKNVPVLATNDIDLVGIAFPLPNVNVNQSLFAGLDDSKIAQLAQWYDEARPISDTLLSASHRDWHLQFIRKNGTVVDIMPASHCDKSTDKAGSTTITCTTAEDRVIIKDSANKQHDSVFAMAPSLYRFIVKDHEMWMPTVPMYTYQKTVHAGESYKLIGNGWIDGNVMLELREGDKVLLKTEAIPQFGRFSKTITIPLDISPGDYYMFFVNPNGSSSGSPIHVE